MKAKAINSRQRARAAKRLHKLLAGLHNAIPMVDIMEALREEGIAVLQEDNRRWSGFLCGQSAQTYFDLGEEDSQDENGQFLKIPNSMLALSWYRYETGRYEVIAYLT